MAYNLAEFWKILASIQGESTDLTEAVDAIAKNEKTTAQRLIDLVIDQIAYNSPDWARLKDFFRDWYASHRTITTFQANISDIYEMPNDQLDELFRSFGYNLSAILKDPISNESPAVKINFFLDLINLYKRKGTPQALLDVLQYYGIIDVDIYELQLQFEDRAGKTLSDLIFKGKVVAGSSDDISPIYLPFNFLTQEDPHWFQTEAQIRSLLTTNKINFPSQSPYFIVKPLFDEEQTDAATGILTRRVQDQYDTWNVAGQPDEGLIAVLPQDAVITITGDTVSMLTLYLSCIYTFNKEFTVGSSASRFICYDGTNTDSVDIIDEFRTITERVYTRDEWKTQWGVYLDTFSRLIGSNFLQDHNDAGDVLAVLHPSVKASLNTLAVDNITVLGTLMRDLGEWVRSNISFGFINMSYILFGIDSLFAEISDVIEFFKPYRTRLVPLEMIQFTSRLFNSIIVEDRLVFDTDREIHDFLTGDSIPCCNIDSTAADTVCLDSTAFDYYSRETYDCGSWYDVGAVTDLPQELFIEIQDDIYDALRCPSYYGDGTAAIYAASNLGAPNAPIVTSDLTGYERRDFDITDIEEGDNYVTGTYHNDLPAGYSLTLNMFNEVDATPIAYSHIVTQKTHAGFTALFSGAMDSPNYHISYDYDKSDNSGIVNIPDGSSIVVVSIPPPPEVVDATSYTIALSLFNDTDANPSFYRYSVIERTASYFTVQFSGAMDSPNYYLDWIIISHDNQDIEHLGDGWASVTVAMFPYEVNDNYGVSLTLLNTIDSTSLIIPFIVTDKRIDGFTVTFDIPTDSPNYKLMWSRPLGASFNTNEYNYYQTGGFVNFDGVPALIDSTAYIYVEGTEGRFDCTHGFDIVDVVIEDTVGHIELQDDTLMLEEDADHMLL
jgi:hypothetical protein